MAVPAEHANKRQRLERLLATNRVTVNALDIVMRQLAECPQPVTSRATLQRVGYQRFDELGYTINLPYKDGGSIFTCDVTRLDKAFRYLAQRSDVFFVRR